jgi:dTDP-glucose 4,6-dehydratase
MATNMKKVLLTGAGGSIGVHIIAHIMHNTDWEIVCLDSYQHKGYKDRITRVCRNHPDWLPKIKQIQHNLTCPISPQMISEIGEVDYILHLAAMSDVFFSIENPVWTIKNNIDSTLVMLEYAKNVKHEAFIYFSTDEVYGAVEKGTQHKEWETHRPSNAYSASKAASEDICYCYWRKGDVKLVITNTMNNFGEMQSASKFPVIIQKAIEEDRTIEIHGSEQDIGTRFYIHSRNVADALLFILKQKPHEHIIGEIDDPDRYNIVGDKCLSNFELAQTIGKLMNKIVKFQFKDFHKDNPAHDIHYGLDGSKLKELGWISPVSFEDSMKNTIEWQQRNPEWII